MPSNPHHIRPIVLSLFRNRDRILVHHCFDADGKSFYRPLGGGIEYGEYAVDALRREMREELSAEITNPRYLFTVENIFHNHGKVGHEIVLVYDADFVDQTLYDRTELTLTAGDIIDKAIWVSISTFHEPHSPPLYPNFLLEKISTAR